MEFNLRNKKPDEKIIVYIKPHWIHLISIILFFILLVFIPVGLYYYFQNFLGNILDNQIIFAVALMLAGIYYLFVYAITFASFIDYEFDFWVVTNYRIIASEQRGLFHREFAEHLIERIQDVSSHQKGFLATMLGYGDVEIQTAGEEEKFIFRDVDSPEQKVSLINELLSKKIQNKGTSINPALEP